MNKHTFYYPSASDCDRVHAVCWLPEGEVKAVLQIAHGMVEFIERYEDFALYLTSRGFAVTGNDHLGHGGSSAPEDYGYFAEKDGNSVLLRDMHRLTQLTKEKYPGVPYFLLGHSMGSFYARQYLFTWGKELDGAIVMGTGHQPKMLVLAGMAVTRVLALFKGWKHRSAFVDGMAFGSYNKAFEPARTDKDWLTKDEKTVDRYLADPRCTFLFTLNGYYNMFKGISRLHDRKRLADMPKELPVLFTAGADDPVGDFGKGVEKAARTFRRAGMRRVAVKLYPGDRHEILNETDRAQVYADLADWLEALL